MSTKEKVLEILYKSKESVSGEAVAKELGISRMSVCKAVDALRRDGHNIESKSRSGYTLVSDSALCAGAICSMLNKPHEVITLDTVDSTNTYLREGDFPSGCVVLSSEQSAGRGRRGKSFASPKGAGVYFSFLLKDALPLENMWAVTFIAAVSVAKTLRSYGADAQVKWVNDVYLGEKKVCGILTEVTLDAEARTSRDIIVGIGINLKKTAYPEEIRHIAVSLEEAGISARAGEVAAKVINCFDELYDYFDIFEILREYRELCFILGREIVYNKDGREHRAVAKEILENGNLAVEENGERDILSSGEISIVVS